MESDNNRNFWEQRWKDANTGWDLNGVSPPIKAYIDTIKNKNITILIPGCGNAYEAEYLLNNGFTNVTLIDISPTLVSKLKKKFEGKPVQVVNGDFFRQSGKYDLILEQTFFCAIDPSMRREYVSKCCELLNPHGKIGGLLFGVNFDKEGPPYGGVITDYEKLFAPAFNLLKLEPCRNSAQPRQGNELFIEFEKK
jgi:SAM-dependent methyltransferase